MDWLVLNAKIQITDEEGKTAEGMVTDFTKDTVNFSIPSDDINFKLFHKGEKIECLVIVKNKGMRFDGVILERINGPIPSYHVGNLTNFKEAQRRQNVRVACSDSVYFTSDREVISNLSFMSDLNNPNAHSRLEEHFKEGIMMDLSAGGLKLSTDVRIDLGQTVIVKFDCKDEELILRATVMHRDLSVKPSGIRYFYGLRFEQIDTKIEDKIINHVFLLMRKTRKL